MIQDICTALNIFQVVLRSAQRTRQTLAQIAATGAQCIILRRALYCLRQGLRGTGENMPGNSIMDTIASYANLKSLTIICLQ
jgi:hypothetical protein